MQEYLKIQLENLKKSPFRSSFHLKSRDLEYLKEKGYRTIKEHTENFIAKRLAPAYISNDGKQTPMRGHPVFIAMHACATCCRSCLYKWHKIPKNKELSSNEQNYILGLLWLG